MNSLILRNINSVPTLILWFIVTLNCCFVNIILHNKILTLLFTSNIFNHVFTEFFYSLVNSCTRSNILSILSCEYHSSQKVFKPCRAFHLLETNKQTNSRIRLNGTSERWDPSRRSTILWVQITTSTAFSNGRTRIDAFRIQLSFCDFCAFWTASIIG